MGQEPVEELGGGGLLAVPTEGLEGRSPEQERAALVGGHGRDLARATLGRDHAIGVEGEPGVLAVDLLQPGLDRLSPLLGAGEVRQGARQEVALELRIGLLGLVIARLEERERARIARATYGLGPHGARAERLPGDVALPGLVSLLPRVGLGEGLGRSLSEGSARAQGQRDPERDDEPRTGAHERLPGPRLHAEPGPRRGPQWPLRDQSYSRASTANPAWRASRRRPARGGSARSSR